MGAVAHAQTELLTSYGDIHFLSENWFVNYFFNNMVYAVIFTYEYYTMALYSLMYVPGFPVFLILSFVQGWTIDTVPYNEDISRIGMEFLEYLVIQSTYKQI